MLLQNDYKSDDSISLFTPSPQKGDKGYNIWTPGDSSFINNDESSLVSTNIRPASSDINTDSYVTSADCSSITDNKGNTTALSLLTDVGNIYLYLVY
jgi:hypothetical protein